MWGTGGGWAELGNCGGATCGNNTVIANNHLQTGLTCITFVILGTINLQFQGPFFPISLWPVLSTVVAHVLGIV